MSSKTRNILIREVPDSVYSWIENERHDKRVSQKKFLLDVLESAASKSVRTAPYRVSMTLVYWKGDKYWLGKLLEHPEIMTQGETLEELEHNIRDAYMLMATDDVPVDYHMKEVALA